LVLIPYLKPINQNPDQGGQNGQGSNA
jgi:hypothetical protein